MAKAHRTLLAQAADLRGRSAGVVRPAVEAVLAAALALGLGQTGWNALNPDAASASTTPGSPDEAGSADVAVAPPAATPFAPRATTADSIALGQLDLLRVTGVRMAVDPARSGAVLAMSDGRQQAFLVGQDVVAGVQLTAVLRDGVVVSHAGGERTIAMPMAQATGFADALMGRAEPAAPVEAAVAAVGAADAIATFSDGDQAWLAATLRNPVREGAAVRGYRLADGAPAVVTAAGLASGDVVEAINGASAGDPLAAIAAVQSGGPVTLTVRRADGSAAAVRFTLDGAALAGTALSGAAP